MALCQINLFSNSMRKMTAVNVTLPEGDITGPYAVFYLLHGLSDDHSAWVRRTSIERYAQGLPLMVVMPDGGRNFYTDAKDGLAVESFIVKDLIDFIDRTFHTVARREGRAIGGLSMGGYGAIKLGLKYPDLFCSINSHSGAPAFAHRAFNAERDAEWIPIFGSNPSGGPDDPFAIAEKIDGEKLPALRIDCGTEDFLLDQNRAFHAHLEQLGIPHEYDEYPGSHEWGYWDTHVQTALQFHALHLDLTGQQPEE